MSKTSKAVAIIAGVFLVALLGYALWPKTNNLGGANAPTNSSFNTTTDAFASNGTQDVVGTHLGSTTTVGVAVGANPNVTTSYVSKIGNDKRLATYQIRVTSVTGTDNNLSFTVQGSNDWLCETQAGAASSTTDVVQSNINWYDAMTHLANRVYPTTIGSGSSTAVYDLNDVTAGTAQELVLTNLNYTCLRFRVSGSSTLIYVGLNTSR